MILFIYFILFDLYLTLPILYLAPNSFESDSPAKENCSPSFGLNKQKNQRRKSTDLLRRKGANHLSKIFFKFLILIDMLNHKLQI